MSNLYSNAIITSKNELDVKFNTPYGEAWGDFLSQTYIAHAKEINSLAEIMMLGTRIPSQALIPYVTSFVSMARIAESSELDVRFNVPYGEGLTGVGGEASIAYRKHLQGVVEIKELDESLHSEFTVPFIKKLMSIARINESLSMDIVMGILQPPQAVLELGAIKDTYTRQSRPYSNYGYAQSLAVGQAAEGEFRTFIEFDLSSAIEIRDQYIMSIELELIKPSNVQGTVSMHEVYTQWAEGFLMWINPINYSQEPITTFQVKGNVVKVDMTEYVKNMLDNDLTRLNVLLKSNDFLVFNSRESGMAPKIVVKYTDPNWVGFIGEVDFYSAATITNSRRRLFHNFFSLLHRSAINSEAILREKGLYDSGAVIANPLNRGEAEILGNQSAVNSIAEIMNTSDLASSFDNNASDSNDSATILTKKLLRSMGEVLPETAFDWKQHQAVIIREYMDSCVDILDKINFGSSAYVLSNFSEGGGEANVIRTNMYSDVIITKSNDKHSEFSVGQASYKDRFSEAIITPFKDNYSTATLLGEVFEDIKSEAILGTADKSNLFNSALIRYREDLHSEVNIGLTEGSSLFSSAWIIGRDVNKQEGLSSLLERSIFNGESIILNEDYKDKHSNTWIIGNDVNEQEGLANLLSMKLFSGDATVRRSNYVERVSETLIIRHDVKDLQGVAEIYRFSDSKGNIDIRQVSQVLGETIIRNKDLRLVAAEAYLNGWYPSYQEAYADILARFNFNRCFAVIRNNARAWIPATDRRLPRQWVRDNFI